MPAFRCCRQEWNLADDDFVPPSLVSTTSRFCLFCWILCANAYIFVTLGRSHGDCSDGTDCCRPQPLWVLAVYLFGELLLEFCGMVVDCLILVVSASGTLQESKKRTQKLRVLLYIRVTLLFPEVCFSVFGLGVALHPQLANQPACSSNHIFQLLLAYSIVTTAVIVLKTASYIVFMDPLGCCSPGPISYVSEIQVSATNPACSEAKPAQGLTRQTESVASITMSGGFRRIAYGRSRLTRRNAQQSLYSRRTIQLWENRINKLACGGLTGSLPGRWNVKSSVHEVAKYLSVFFENTKYTLSDLTTAIVLVMREQKDLCRRGHLLQRNVRKKLIEQMRESDFCDGKAQYKYQPPVPVDFSNQAECNEVSDAIYFFRYAMAVYGWPLYVFGNPTTGCCKLCCKSLGICCLQRKCCQCNDAAFKLMADMGVTDDNIQMVYCSAKNELFCSPFTVVLDHRRKSLVVAIRGTLSMEDVITSLSVSLTPLYMTEPPYSHCDTQVHKGWHLTAVNILKELECNGVFEQFKKYPNYQLVVVGHSLGGAVSAILSVLIKMDKKEVASRLKSFGYSTPGCVFSYPLAKYCRDFVTTVVLDNDILSHLNWRSLLLLTATLKEKLETCCKPKYQVLYIDPLIDTCKMTCLRGRQEEDSREADSLSERRVTDLVKEVFDNPDWNSLGHFSGHHLVTFEAAVNAKVYLGKWKKKAFGVNQKRESQQILETHEVEARKFTSAPAFLPGKVLQVDTGKERLCPWLPWPTRTRSRVRWTANEEYCLVHLHNGPLTSHLPDHLHRALSLVNQQHLMQKGLEHIFSEAPPNFSFDGVIGVRLYEEEESAFYQSEAAAANGTDLEGLNAREVKVELH